MKYISPLITDARNKVGGSVYARNRAGVYVRSRVSPVQPRTSSQVANRNNFATFSSAWRALTQTQRDGWNTLAPSVTLHDTLGQVYRPSGLQLYISCNRNLSLIGQGPISAAPVSKPIIPTLHQFVPEYDSSGGNIYDAVWNDYSLSNTELGHIQVSATPGLSPGITFIGRTIFRNMPRPISVVTGFIAWQSAWASVFGTALAPGKVIGTRLRYIDPSTGWAGPVSRYTSIVAAV